jgi:methionyl-tRNA synthetase
MQKEESYFFRLSRYENRLLQHYAANPDFIRPENRYNEIVSFVRGGLRDLSVSRRRLTWGVPVPDDPRHVIWVWLDALTNYVSALGGFEDEAPLYRKFWPADVHLVGKDIVRFHAVYWPAFLMSAGLEPPRQVFVHGWWTVEGQKISKSLGNAVRPGELFARYGVDATRYFLLREFPFGGDGDFSSAAVVARYNGELANDLGNLLSRTVTMSARYLGGKVPAPSPGGALADAAAKAVAEHARATSELSFSRACEAVFALVRAGNKLIDENAPWALHKSGNQARLGEVLGAVCEALRVAGALLAPLMPAKMSELRTQLGVPEPAFQIAGLAYGSWPGPFRVSPGAPLFPRLSAIKEAILDDLSREVADSVEERSGGLGTRRQPLNLVQKVADTVQVTHTAAVAVPAADSKPEVSYEDFGKLDLRVGRVKHAERIPKSEKLLRLVVDIGEDRQVVAGVGKRFAPEDLVGRRVVVVANLKPIKLMGVESRGMVLAAGGDADLELVSVPDGVAPGARVK